MKIKNLLPLFVLALAPFALAEAGKDAAGHKECAKDCEKPHGPRGEKKPCLDALTDAEKAQVKAAHEAAAKDPAFVAARDAHQAAREKAKESKSPEDRKAAMEAGKATREAHQAAMLKADPSVGDLIAKCRKDCDKGKGEGKGEGKGKGERKGKCKGDSCKPAAPESK